MDFRIIELADTVVYGVSKQYEGQGYKTRGELRHSIWANNCDDVPSQLCEGGWNQPGSTSYDGVWYGIWQDGNSALMLVCARLRHVAGTQWGNKKYMNMKHLEAAAHDAFIAG